MNDSYLVRCKIHVIFWVAVVILFVATVFLFRDVLLPFVLGLAVAYLLNPLVNKITSFGVSRGFAALGILIGFLLGFIGLMIAISPIVYREFLDLYRELPFYVEKFWLMVAPVTHKIEEYFGTQDAENFIKENSSAAAAIAKVVLQKVGSGGQAFIDLVSVTVFMPVVAFFMMKEWPQIVQWIYSLVPRPMEKTVHGILREMDSKISGFVRGQITVCFILGIMYAAGLSLLGLKYGFVIGFASGAFSIIPMVGSILGLVFGVMIAWFQAGDFVFVSMVVGVFALGQFIEGNFLTPKLVGDSVGLHPLWIFFALLAGGSLLGLLGMFLAVPMAAIVGVLLSFAIKKYKVSEFYKGMNSNVSAKN